MSNVGNNISLACEAHLAEGIHCNCVNMRWLKNGREVVTDERVIVTSTSSGTTLQSNISISPLLFSDSGTYRCEVATQHPQGTSTNVMSFQDVPLTVVGMYIVQFIRFLSAYKQVIFIRSSLTGGADISFLTWYANRVPSQPLQCDLYCSCWGQRTACSSKCNCDLGVQESVWTKLCIILKYFLHSLHHHWLPWRWLFEYSWYDYREWKG